MLFGEVSCGEAWCWKLEDSLRRICFELDLGSRVGGEVVDDDKFKKWFDSGRWILS